MREYTLIRSNRKTLSLQISGDQLLARAPKKMSKRAIDDFVCSKENWIDKHLRLFAELDEKYADEPALSDEQIETYKKSAREYIPKRVAHFAQIMDVMPASVRITSAKTRWGSCSAKHRLSFSWRLMLADERAIDYVVIHELAHITEMNHSKAFWAIVTRYIPDYKEQRKKLRELAQRLS